jgi:hypothetical protein
MYPVNIKYRDVPDVKFAWFRMLPDIASRIPDPDSGYRILIQDIQFQKIVVK